MKLNDQYQAKISESITIVNGVTEKVRYSFTIDREPLSAWLCLYGNINVFFDTKEEKNTFLNNLKQFCETSLKV